MTIQTRLTDEQYIEVKEAADKLGLSTASYMRLLLFNAKVIVKVDVDAAKIDEVKSIEDKVD